MICSSLRIKENKYGLIYIIVFDVRGVITQCINQIGFSVEMRGKKCFKRKSEKKRRKEVAKAFRMDAIMIELLTLLSV